MAYLDAIKAGAVSTWRTHQVLPSVVGAQAALESGWGTSKLAKPPYNNQFGIKASADWTGRTVNMPTREYLNGAWVTVNADFRAYDSAGDSVKDHGAFFTSTPWRENNYKAVVGETDYKKACWALQNAPAPYATDTGYAQKLINLIENNNLQAWDKEALADNSNTVATQTQQTIVSKMVGADLTDAGKQYVRDLNVTMIGDSLGVGTKPYFESLVPKANYDVLGSRQITHATNSLNGTYVLQQMKNAGTLKEYVVVILGTNRGVTEQEVNSFASIAGDNHKIIFVDTASEVAHINTLSVYYQDAAKRLNNVYFANWRLKANSLKPQYYSKDGANGEYIHMTPLGYQKHAEFIAQALYEVATANFTERTASTPKADYYDIKTLELDEDGLITYDAWKVNTDGTSTKYKATKQTDIKGLHSPYGDPAIYNSTANSIWGSGGSVNHSDWIETIYQNNEETDMLELVKQAGKSLLERSEPSRVYTISLLDIPVELTIGDTGIFIDHEYTPPLYIEARVLAMTTSRTNPKLCKVTVGNVTELKAQDKSGVYALMAQLGEVRRDLVKERIESEPIEMIVTTTNGFVLGDRVAETNLVARVIKGTLDVTEDYESFEWERVSGNSQSDATYNQVLKNSTQSSVLSVVAKDIVGNQSKFVARAYNATGELISHQEIVIKRVETALWTDTDTAPPYAIDGATWTKPDGSQWVLVDGVWEEKVNQAQMFTVKADIDAAKLIADNAKAEADDARQRAEDALTEAGISTDLAQTAKDLAQLAEDNAETALTNAQTAISEAGIAASQAVQAINTADTAKTNAQTALTNAQTALTEAGSAKTTANNLTVRVDDVEAEVELKASQTTVDGLSGTVSNHSTTLSQHANQIASKADSSFVNTIKGTVDTHTTEIAQNATEIASKASSSSVNTLTGRVDTAETTITQHAGLIASKASQTEVDTVKGTVSNHTSTLSQHATEISARLTSTQVNSLVDGKGLAKVTYVDNQISATAEGFGSELTRVEGKIPTNLGGTNLLRNTSGSKSWRNFDYVISRPLPAGKYVYRFRAKGNGTFSARVYINDDSAQNRVSWNPGYFVTITPNWQWFTVEINLYHTDNQSTDRIYMRVYGGEGDIIDGEKAKLEKGNIPSDYSPAPEDTMMENDFTVFKNSYQSTVDSINTELSKTAKITDLNGMVTESVLATKQFVTQGSITTTLSDYLKTTDLNGKVKETVAYQDIKETTDRYTRVIGSTDAESRTKIAQIAMTDSVFKTTVLDKMEFDTSNTFSTKTGINSLVNMMHLYRDESRAPNGIAFAGRVGGGGSFRLLNVITRNGWWTVSGWVRGSQNTNGSFRLDIADGPYSHYISFENDNNWKYFEFSHEVKNHSSTYNFVDFNNIANLYYYIKDLKIEQNHKATPYSFSAVDVATQSQVTQLANNWAVRMLNSKNDIVSQINLSDSTFLIEAKNIVGLGDAVINGKLTVTGDMIAGTISADKISGGTLTGTTFITTESATGFSTHIYNGAIEFKHQIFTLGHIHATVSSTTGAINGFAVVQRPGYIFSIDSRSKLPNNNTSIAVLQVPADSTSESRKLNIFAQGGFRINSDTLNLENDKVIVKKPFQALDGFMASHEQSNEGAKIADAGNLIYSVDKAGSVMIHRFMVRRKDGTWPNNGLAIYEDGRVAVVVNGVWKQL